MVYNGTDNYSLRFFSLKLKKGDPKHKKGTQRGPKSPKRSPWGPGSPKGDPFGNSGSGLFRKTSAEDIRLIIRRYEKDFDICGYHQTLNDLRTLLKIKTQGTKSR